MRLLFLGDVVGEGGCDFLLRRLPDFKRKNNIDVCIANGENSAQGNGVTPKSVNMVLDSGVDMLTMGNHVFKRPEIMDFLEGDVPVVRPYNYPAGAPGQGVGIIDKGRYRIAVINLSGQIYFERANADNPFKYIDELLERAKSDGAKFIFVDFHAEATSEKRAMGFYLDGKVSAVFGTHTHAQTADAQVLPKGTGYITDLGMTGVIDSILGVKKEIIINRLKNNDMSRFEQATGMCMLNGCVFDVDESTGLTKSAKLIYK